MRCCMPIKKSKNDEVALKDLLIAASHEKLVDILLSLYASNSNIQKQLDIIFAGLNEDPKKIISIIKKEIVSLKKSSRLIDYYESNALADRLNQLRLRILRDLSEKSPDTAFNMMLDFLDLHKNTIERVDDSNGVVGEVFCEACRDLGTLAGNSLQLQNGVLVEVVFIRFMHNEYGIYDAIIDSFKDIFNNQDFDLLQEKFERVANDKNFHTVKIGLKSIADCKNDADEYIRACSFKDGICAYDHLEIAKRLIKHWRSKEALEWLEGMELPSQHAWYQERKSLRVQALELDGNYEEAQKERLSWFFKTLSPKLYGEILKSSNKDFKQSFRLEAIEKAFKFLQPHAALNFLVKIQEFEEVAKFVHVRFGELDGEQYYTLRPAADLLKSVDPIASTLLYRKMIAPVLDKTKSKYYHYAARDLVACGALSSEIKIWGEIENHDQYFKEIEDKHKRKTRFWSEYKSTLQKQAVKQKKETNNA